MGAAQQESVRFFSVRLIPVGRGLNAAYWIHKTVEGLVAAQNVAIRALQAGEAEYASVTRQWAEDPKFGVSGAVECAYRRLANGRVVAGR